MQFQAVDGAAASLVAITICIAAAALEGLLAGRGVKRRLERLRQPHRSPPLAVWVGIGLAYYVICFIVLSRLLPRPPSTPRSAALALMLLLLVGNALWNLVFFRLENLRASVAGLMAYAAVAVMLSVLLARLDPVSFWVFLPYLLYLPYATWWLLSMRRLNRGAS